MEYKNFKKLIDNIKDCHELMDKYYDVLKIDTVWNSHNTVISDLLIEMYGEPMVDYVLYEFLEGRHAPYVVNIDDNTQLIEPLNTVRDLWKVMEKYKSPGMRLKEDKVIIKGLTE